MGYNELELELRKLLAQVDRWREMGYMPVIEQGLALSRLQKAYAELMELPCGEAAPGETEQEPDRDPEDTPPNEHSVDPDAKESQWRESDDEEVMAQEASDQADREEEGDVVYVAPDDESFDEENAKESLKENEPSEADEDDDFADDAAEEEADRKSEEAYPGQESGTRDTDPSSADEFADEVAQTVREESEKSSPEKPQPTIFGIPVSQYARHEIIDTLFKGNTALFEKEEAILGEMDSLEDALVYIGENYQWIPENAATLKFIDLLEERFNA